MEGKHVVESMMLGAKICEFSSGTLWRGWSLLRRSAAFLVEYMKEQEYASLDDFRGLGVQYMMPADLIDWGVGRVAAAVDAGKCTGCGICCHNLCWAMSLDGDGDIASCSEELCGACGLCVAVCPENAVTLEAAAHTRTEQQIYAALADAEERALQA
ncbi:MAG: 4Fe-4S binding protein [Thermoleophilia bacterium]|nr:4Fe-4S binding protein [Thermoleophilia bacterium]